MTIDESYSAEFTDKTSSAFKELSAELQASLQGIYETVPGEQLIEIEELR